MIQISIFISYRFVRKEREREGKTEDKIVHFIPILWAEAGANKNVISADFDQSFCEHKPQQTHAPSSLWGLSGKDIPGSHPTLAPCTACHA